jgi:hypothetical protein
MPYPLSHSRAVVKLRLAQYQHLGGKLDLNVKGNPRCYRCVHAPKIKGSHHYLL